MAVHVINDHNFSDVIDVIKQNILDTSSLSSKVDCNSVINNEESIDPSCVVSLSMMSSKVQIGEKTKVEFSYIGEYVKIGKKCQIKNCIIMDKAEIGDDCELLDCRVDYKYICENGRKEKKKNLTSGIGEEILFN
mmetsp:Transcript_26594/g.58524  ORF Transcript_26594/g.58524 Transcript_26594/m.58524 type:complete len:135 (+) Transcript_26594:934-1338(+)